MRNLKLLVAMVLLSAGCTTSQGTQGNRNWLGMGDAVELAQEAITASNQDSGGTRFAVLFYFYAWHGKGSEYNYYIGRVINNFEVIARNEGAFVSSTTFQRLHPHGRWTHLRVFVVDNQNKAEVLEKRLKQAYERMEPFAGRQQADRRYARSLRIHVDSEVVRIVH